MTVLVWHSRTYDGDTEIREDFVFDDGYVFTFNTADWYDYQGRRVYQGEHLLCKTPLHTQHIVKSYEQLAKHLETCDEPHHATQRMEILYERDRGMGTP